MIVRNRSHRAIALCTFTLVMGVSAVQGAERFDYGFVFWSPNDKDERLPWAKVLTQMKDNLGRAKQVNYFLDTCYAGQAISQSDPDNGGIDLGMPYTMSVSTTATKKMSFDGDVPDLNPPRRLKVGNTYYYSFNDYLTKRLKDKDPVPSVKQLFDAAKVDVLADTGIGAGRVPQFMKRGSGNENLKIKGDGDKSRTLLFGGDMEEMYDPSHDESYRALNAYSFDSQVMYRHSDEDTSRDPPIQGKGTWSNFGTSLTNLKTQLAAGNAGTQVVNIFQVGHGYRKALNDNRRQNLSLDELGGPGQGYEITGTGSPSGDQLNIPMDMDFWNTLKAGLFPPPIDEPDLTRMGEPQFDLAYSAHALNDEFSISIGGVSLGTFTLPEDSPSGTLVVPLDDSFLSQLIAVNDGATSLTIQFNLSMGDTIQLGLLDDLLSDPSYASTTYGTGISTVVAGRGVPEPATAGLMIGAILAAVRSRRRRR